MLFTYPPLDLSRVNNDTLNLMNLISNVTYNKYLQHDPFDTSHLGGLLTLSQPIYNGTGKVSGALGFQFNARTTIDEVVTANVESNGFIYDQLVVFDVKEMT